MRVRNKLLYTILTSLATIILLKSCKNKERINYERYYVSGRRLYNTYCQNCHNTDGTGLGNLYPPLTDTTFLKNNKNKLACIIKYGADEKMIINQKLFEGKMPANNNLSDIEIAQLIVYITNSFNNRQGMYNVENAGTDLKQCK